MDGKALSRGIWSLEFQGEGFIFYGVIWYLLDYYYVNETSIQWDACGSFISEVLV